MNLSQIVMLLGAFGHHSGTPNRGHLNVFPKIAIFTHEKPTKGLDLGVISPVGLFCGSEYQIISDIHKAQGVGPSKDAGGAA